MLDKKVLTFMHVAEKGSFLKAAEALYLSAVSVKKQMDALEAHVGARLFDRTSKGAKLTPAGRTLYEEAQKMEFLSERALSRTRQASESEAKSIRIGTSPIRPCKELLDLWETCGGRALPFHLEIVPFDDDTVSLNAVVDSLGKQVDCFIAPCDSNHWREACSILVFETLPFCVGVPRSNPLSEKPILEWEDLDGESIMLTPGSDSPIVGSLRADIKTNHPFVKIIDCPMHFDLSTFNKCEQSGYLMQTYRVWDSVHPALITVPVNWEYTMPYGIVYSKNPSQAVREFMRVIEDHLAS